MLFTLEIVLFPSDCLRPHSFIGPARYLSAPLIGLPPFVIYANRCKAVFS